MPIYVFRCADCDTEKESLLALGDTSARPCPECGGSMRQRFGRVGINYTAFGFTATDKLVNNPQSRSPREFARLAEKAQEIADS